MSHIFIITGTSGGGKDSVVKALLEKDSQLYRVVTHTSRARRPTEHEGVDYYFVTESEFKKMIENNELIEWAIVYSQYKGISTAEIQKGIASGQDVLLRINIDGVEKIKQLFPEAISFFITAPSDTEVIGRLQSRGTDGETDKQLRIQELEREHAYANQCNHIIYNVTGQFDKTLAEVESLIQKYRSVDRSNS